MGLVFWSSAKVCRCFLIVFLMQMLCWGFVSSAYIKDLDNVEEAYDKVRSGIINWCCLKYVSRNSIALAGTGTAFGELMAQFGDDDAAFAYLRIQVDGGMRFVFITWIGPGVPPLQKAKMSTDKALVKQVITDFANEILTDDKNDLTEDKIRNAVRKSDTAAYGKGQ